MTIVISISATHFLILRIKPSLDFADQFPAYTCCLEIPKKNLNWSNLGAIWWIMVSGYKIYIILGQILTKNFVCEFHVKIQKMRNFFFFKCECGGHIFWSILTCLRNLECSTSLISSK